MWLTVGDLLGIAVFALAGGIVGVKAQFDLFGTIVAGTVTAIGGGVLRDMMLGATPVPGLSDWRYLTTAVVFAGLAVALPRDAPTVARILQVLDAFGMALFAVAGASKAVTYGLFPGAACVLGIITAAGGGLMRDLLVGEVPQILRGEVYALAAGAGGALTALGLTFGHRYGIGPAWAVGGGFALALALRLGALLFGWRSPLERRPEHDGRAAAG